MPTSTTPAPTYTGNPGTLPNTQQAIANAIAAIQNAAGAAPATPNGGILAGATVSKATKKSTSSNEPDLRKMLHALLDACADGESIVLTKFKVDGTIKLRFGYNISTQVSQKTIKASGIKEACGNALEQLIKDKTIKVSKP